MHVEDKWDSYKDRVLNSVERHTWYFLRALLTNYEEICILSTPFSFSQKNERAKDRNISIKFGDVKTTRDYASILKFEFDK